MVWVFLVLLDKLFLVFYKYLFWILFLFVFETSWNVIIFIFDFSLINLSVKYSFVIELGEYLQVVEIVDFWLSFIYSFDLSYCCFGVVISSWSFIIFLIEVFFNGVNFRLSDKFINLGKTKGLFITILVIFFIDFYLKKKKIKKKIKLKI